MGAVLKILAASALLAGAAPANADPAPIAATAASPARTTEQPEPRPAIWLLADEDTKVYLFGTFHILPPGFRWRSPAVENMIRNSNELVLEVTDGEAALIGMIGAMQLGKEVPLAWRVSRDRRAALAEMIAEMGLEPSTFDGLQSWAAALMLISFATVQQMTGDTDLEAMAGATGVEDALEAEFRESGRPISAVETMEEQMSFFGGLSFADQRALLEAMIDSYRSGVTAVGVSERDWVRGNVDALAIDRTGMPPMLYDVLLPRRNRAWTDWLIARLDRPGTVLFAVGAGHLAGPESVQAMLRARGFTARRIH
jgi:uncharacterized protein YbaP (TraB family)